MRTRDVGGRGGLVAGLFGPTCLVSASVSQGSTTCENPSDVSIDTDFSTVKSGAPGCRTRSHRNRHRARGRTGRSRGDHRQELDDRVRHHVWEPAHRVRARAASSSGRLIHLQVCSTRL